MAFRNPEKVALFERGMIRCSSCVEVNQLDSFSKSKASWTGYCDICKRCARVRYETWAKANPDVLRCVRKATVARRSDKIRIYRRKNRESAREACKRWRDSHPGWGREHAAKRRAIKLNATIGDIKPIVAFISTTHSMDRVRCYWCKKLVPKKLRQVDHIIPLSRGGAHSIDNLCRSCRHCNLSKNNQMPEEFSAQRLLL